MIAYRKTLGPAWPTQVIRKERMPTEFKDMIKGKKSFFAWKSAVRGESFVEESLLL